MYTMVRWLTRRSHPSAPHHPDPGLELLPDAVAAEEGDAPAYLGVKVELLLPTLHGGELSQAGALDHGHAYVAKARACGEVGGWDNERAAQAQESARERKRAQEWV